MPSWPLVLAPTFPCCAPPLCVPAAAPSTHTHTGTHPAPDTHPPTPAGAPGCAGGPVHAHTGGQVGRHHVPGADLGGGGCSVGNVCACVCVCVWGGGQCVGWCRVCHKNTGGATGIAAFGLRMVLLAMLIGGANTVPHQIIPLCLGATSEPAGLPPSLPPRLRPPAPPPPVPLTPMAAAALSLPTRAFTIQFLLICGDMREEVHEGCEVRSAPSPNE